MKGAQVSRRSDAREAAQRSGSDRKPEEIGVAVIGAGPYGLSVAAHLEGRGVPYRIFGQPMDSWRQHMPAGMMLKSRPFASNLSDPRGLGTLADYCAARGIPYDGLNGVVDLDLFVAYGLAFQRRFVSRLDRSDVVSVDNHGEGFEIRTATGGRFRAEQVVMAVGICYFGRIPTVLGGLPPTVMSHSYAHRDLSVFAGRHVTVIGAGASAVDVAIGLREAGATPLMLTRGAGPVFYPVEPVGPRRLRQRVTHPIGALGDWLPFWLYEKAPGLFRRLPGPRRLALLKGVLGPASPDTLRARFEAGVEVSARTVVVGATLESGRVRLVVRSDDGPAREIWTDHVIAATGYRPSVAAVDCLSGRLRSVIRTHIGMPMVSARFESSVPGLFFVGLSAADSFGPLMRFVAGARFAANRVATELARRCRTTTSPTHPAGPHRAGPSVPAAVAEPAW